MTRSIRSYSELVRIDSFVDRFDYLSLGGVVGEETFGHERHLNQRFYRSAEWRRVRNLVITRDQGRDLAHVEHELFEAALIHHMNPISARDIIDGNPDILNPEYLITTIHSTHNAIHYGDASLLRAEFIERTPGDTLPWRRN